MLLKDSLRVASPFATAYEGEPVADPEAAEAAAEAARVAAAEAEKNKISKVKFTPEQQAFVNSLMNAEKQKAQAKSEALITQLETEKNRSSTTAAEKQQLDERIEGLKAEFATKEELRSREVSKKVTELETSLKRQSADVETWRSRFERTSKINALTSAASSEKAYNTDVVVTILEPKTRLVEVTGEDGKTTGEFEPRVKIQTKDKDGKAVTLDLDPVGAVKQLKEMPEFMNLFISPASGGLGGGNLGRGGAGGSSKPAHEMSTEEYIAARRKGRKA